MSERQTFAVSVPRDSFPWTLRFQVHATRGNRVVLPGSMISDLLRAKIRKPWFFEISEAYGSFLSLRPESGAAYVVGVQNSGSPESKGPLFSQRHVSIPEWLAETLGLESDSSVVLHLVRGVREARTLVIRPVEKAFRTLLETSGGLELLEQGLQYYPVLKKGMVIPVRVYDRSYDICIEDIVAREGSKVQDGESKDQDGESSDQDGESNENAVCSLLDNNLDSWKNTGDEVPLEVEIRPAKNQEHKNDSWGGAPESSVTPLSEQHVRCSHRLCGMYVMLEDLQEHAKESHLYIECVCGIRVFKPHLESHKMKECPCHKRCYHCLKPCVVDGYTDHENSCSENRKPCKECGDAVPIAKLFSDHLKECSNVCDLCGEIVMRRNHTMAEHQETQCDMRKSKCSICGKEGTAKSVEVCQRECEKWTCRMCGAANTEENCWSCSISKDAKLAWKCPRCTSLNANKNTDTHCRMCNRTNSMAA